MEQWITSDTHFDHKNIIGFEGRDFKDHLEMTEVLIDNWNSVVKPNDLVIHLGDVFFCRAARALEISKRLNGRKILVLGNHDIGFSKTKFRKLGFEPKNYYFKDDFLLTHRPQHEVPLRVAVDSGLLRGNIHGHVHTRIEGLDQSIYRCMSVELTDYIPKNWEDVVSSFK